MRWPLLTINTADALRALAEHGPYAKPWNRMVDWLEPIEGEGRRIYSSTRGALERFGMATYRDGAFRITEHGRDYLFALAVGDAPQPVQSKDVSKNRARMGL